MLLLASNTVPIHDTLAHGQYTADTAPPFTRNVDTHTSVVVLVSQVSWMSEGSNVHDVMVTMKFASYDSRIVADA